MSKTLTPIMPEESLFVEFLKPLRISQNELARAISVPPDRISKIISGNREITSDTALRLSRLFGIEPEFWLNLQTRYNMKIAGTLLEKELEKSVDV